VSEHTYRQHIVDLIGAGQQDAEPKRLIVEEIVNHVEAALAAGEPWAQSVAARWALAGAAKDYTDAFKALNSTTYIRADGRRVRKTVAYSRTRRDEASGQVVGQQMQAWWSMSRYQLMDLRRDITEQRDRLDDVVTALDQVIAAMERHPYCVTARDAWLADGRDLDEVDLSEVAG
jgi:hypothetical protein